MSTLKISEASEGSDGRIRTVIENVSPEINGGRFPVKRVAGQAVVVEADIFADGHDAVRCLLMHRKEHESQWTEVDMSLLVNDRWRAKFTVPDIGRYCYTLTAWVDHFLSWRQDFVRRTDTDDIVIALQILAQLINEAAGRAQASGNGSHGGDAEKLSTMSGLLLGKRGLVEKKEMALSEELALLMARYPDRRFASRYERQLSVVVDRKIAGFGSWYEMFPRSAASEAGRHGTFKDCAKQLPYIAGMGFDVLYLPPIHPVGRTNRKGRNNALHASAEDVGSVWAIGAREGGHKSLLAELGTLKDFQFLQKEARSFHIEIALDLAFQCAPDHPYVKQHPEWFRQRPDGSIQYAENPPKKYQDIYPFEFESTDWRNLWQELRSVVDYWIEQGVLLFRVDNPHTKPFAFWEWLIDSVKRDHPKVLFLSEAFTKPKVMHRLAKLGFSQSYTYFTWRNTKQELTEYFTELTQSDTREYFRPNCWPNTPDILPAYLQSDGSPAFMTRLVLAATLCSNYGIYGPAFELMERKSMAPDSEEYRDSEKYQLRHWNLQRPDSLSQFIARVNRIRHDNIALQEDWNLRFLSIDNKELLAYIKATADLSNIIVVVVNLDARYRQSGWLELDLSQCGIAEESDYQMDDLLNGVSYQWRGLRNFVMLDPLITQAHIFQLKRQALNEI